tara:strand:- start:3415 stop:12156 length:8742 start_codon:yes stop_codon:yes gene_type:complete
MPNGTQDKRTFPGDDISLDDILGDNSPVSQERNIWDTIGASMSDAWDTGVDKVGGFGEDVAVGLIESATFGYKDGRHLGLSADKSGIGYTLGYLGGYMIPYGGAVKLGHLGVKGAGKALKIAAGGSVVNAGKWAQKLNADDAVIETIRGALKKPGRHGTLITKGGKKISADDFIEEVVRGSGLIRAINNFDDVMRAFRKNKMTANEVDNIIEKGVGNYLARISKEYGYTFGTRQVVNGKPVNTVVKNINERIRKLWSKDGIGGKPINTLPDLFTESKIMSKAFGYEKYGAADVFFGHAAEDALAYAVVEGTWYAARKSRGEDTYMTPARMLTEMALFGPAVAGIRFIPGGARKGPLNIFNSETRNTLQALVRGTKNYYKKTNVKGEVNEEARKEVLSAYLMYSRMNQPGVSRAMRLSGEKLPNKMMKLLEGKTHPNALKKLIKNGTQAEKEAAAEYMKLSLNGISKEVLKLRGDYIKLIKDDFFATKKRQIIGGGIMSMAGATEYFFGNSLDEKTMLTTAMLGYFLFKRGHRMTYKNRTIGDEPSKWSSTSTGWDEKLGDREIRYKEQAQMLDAMGVSIDHPAFMAIRNSLIENSPIAPHEAIRMANIDAEDPITLQINSLLEQGFLKPINEKIPITKKEKSKILKIKDHDIVKELYKNFSFIYDNHNFVDKQNTFKKWEELSMKEIESFTSTLTELGVRLDMPTDLIQLYVKPTLIQRQNKLNDLSQNILDIYNILGGQFNSTIRKSELRDDPIHLIKKIRLDMNDLDTKLNDPKHFDLLDEFDHAISFLNEFGSGRIQLQEGAPVVLNSRNFKNQDEVFNAIQNMLDDFSDLFNSGGKIKQQEITFKNDFPWESANMWQSLKDSEDLVIKFKNIMAGGEGSPSPILDLITKIFQDNNGIFRWDSNNHFKYGKGFSDVNKEFVETIAPLLRSFVKDDIQFHESTKVVLKNSDVDRLRRWFVEEGIATFNYADKITVPFKNMAWDLNWKDDFMGRRKIDELGNIVSYNNKDRIILQSLEEAGLLSGRNSNTIVMDIAILGDIDLNKYKSTTDFIDFLNTYNVDGTQKEVIQNFAEKISKNRDKTTASQNALDIITALKEEIAPYIKRRETINGNDYILGHLQPANQGKVKRLWFSDEGNIDELLVRIREIKEFNGLIREDMFVKSVKNQVDADTKLRNKMIGEIFNLMTENKKSIGKFYNHLVSIGYLTKEGRIKTHKELDNVSKKQYDKRLKQIIEDLNKTFKEEEARAQDKSDLIDDNDLQHSRELEDFPNTISKLIESYPNMINGKNYKLKETDLGNYIGKLDSEFLKLKSDDGILNPRTVFLAKMREDIINTHPDIDVGMLDQQLIAVGANLDNKVTLRRITYNEDLGFGRYEDVKFEQNALFRSLSKIWDDLNGVNLEDAITVINNKGYQSNVFQPASSLDNPVFFDKVVNEFTGDGYLMIDGDLKKKATVGALEESLQTYQAIPVRLNETTVVAVKVDERVLDAIANQYVAWRQKHNLPLNNLENKFLISKKEGKGIYQFDYKLLGQKQGGGLDGKKLHLALEPIMRDLVFGQKAPLGFGEKTWLAIRAGDEQQQFDALARFKLHSNKSAKWLSDEGMKDLSDFIGKTKNDDLKDIKKTIDDISRGKYKLVVIQDELPDGTINPLFSQRQREVDNYNNNYEVDITQSKNDTDFKKEYKGYTETQKRAHEAGRKAYKALKDDVSIMDAMTLQPKEIYDLQALLLGNPLADIDKVSGLKIVGNRAMEDGEIGLIKTAGIMNAKDSVNIPKQVSENDNIIFVSKSAYKDLIKTDDGKSMSTELNSKIFSPDNWDDFGKIDERHLMDYRMEDFSLLSSKGAKEGKIPLNLSGFFTWMKDGKTALDDFVDYNYRNRLHDETDTFNKIFTGGVNNRPAARRMLLALAELNSRKISAETDLSDTQAGVLLQFAKHGGDPLVFQNEFFDMFIDERVINAVAKHSNDSVIQTDLNGELKSMIADEKGIIEYGETYESWVAGQRVVDSDNMAFIVKTGLEGEDKLVHISELKEMLKDKEVGTRLEQIEHLTNNKKRKELKTLEDWVNEVKDYDDIQVASMTFRNPITRSNSIIIEGIKAIGSQLEYNKKVVSSGDVIHQLKGDYDIDNVISMFSQPVSVWRGINSALGKHIYAPKSEAKADNMTGFKLDDPDSFNKLLESKMTSNVIKGAVMNMPEIIRFATMVKSDVAAIGGKPFETGGLVIKVGDNKFIRVKPGISENYDLVAEIDKLNQQALDSDKNGYNRREFAGKKTIQDNIYWGENGIFEIVDAEGGKPVQPTPLDKFIVREYLGIFEKYLTGSGGDWSSGSKRSVKPHHRVRVLEEYAQDLVLAEKIIKDKLVKILGPSLKWNKDQTKEILKDLDELNFGKHNINSNFHLKLANSDATQGRDYMAAVNLENVSPRDWENILLYKMYHTENSYRGSTEPGKRLFADEEWNTIAYDFISSQSVGVKTLIDNIKDASDAQYKLKQLQNTHESDLRTLTELKKAADKDDLQVKFYQDRVDNYQKKHEKLKKELMNKWISDKSSDIHKDLKARVEIQLRKEMGDSFSTLSDKDLQKEINKRLKDSVLEPRKYEDTLSEIIARHTAGILDGRMAMANKGLTKSEMKFVDELIDNYIYDFNQVSAGKSAEYHPLDYDTMNFNYEARLVQLISDNGLSDKIDSVLARLMAPKIDLQKNLHFSEMNNILQFVSPDKSLVKRIKLVHKFNNTKRKELYGQIEQSDSFGRLFATTSRDVVRIMMGGKTDYRRVYEDTIFKSSLPYNNFSQFINSHSSSILQVSDPVQSMINMSGLSRLSFYEQFYVQIGSGLYKSQVRKGKVVGDTLIAHTFEGRGDYRVDTVETLREAQEKGVTVFKEMNDGLIAGPRKDSSQNTSKSNPTGWHSRRMERARTHCGPKVK